MSKRATRQNRLNTSLALLKTFHAYHAKGLSSWETCPDSYHITTDVLFNPSSRVSDKFKGLPNTPFLVPAVLDALHASDFTGIVEIVPAEADTYCARVASVVGATVLTSDSDLLAYDLGPDGAVIFFNHIERKMVGKKNCAITSARIFCPSVIAKRLGVANFSRLAFEVKVDPLTTIVEASKRAQKDIQDTIKQNLYEQFLAEYSVEDLHSELEEPLKAHHLDPRISELAVQCAYQEQEELQMYLPLLIDDPSRVSAWNVGWEVRCFSYSLLPWNNFPGESKLYEYSRRDGRMVGYKVGKMTEEQQLEYGGMLCRRLAVMKTRLRDIPKVFAWRIYAMSETLSWYVEDGRTLPSNLAIMAVLTGNTQKILDWGTIQLSAQIEGVLYSYRILKQILEYVLDEIPSTNRWKIKTSEFLERLPSLDQILPSHLSLPEDSEYRSNWDKVLELVETVLTENDQLTAVALLNEQDEVEKMSSQVDIYDSTKKSKKQKSGSEKKRVPTGAGSTKRPDNLYSLLATT